MKEHPIRQAPTCTAKVARRGAPGQSNQGRLRAAINPHAAAMRHAQAAHKGGSRSKRAPLHPCQPLTLGGPGMKVVSPQAQAPQGAVRHKHTTGLPHTVHPHRLRHRLMDTADGTCGSCKGTTGDASCGSVGGCSGARGGLWPRGRTGGRRCGLCPYQ
jgi:hypothetical protein